MTSTTSFSTQDYQYSNRQALVTRYREINLIVFILYMKCFLQTHEVNSKFFPHISTKTLIAQSRFEFIILVLACLIKAIHYML